MADFLVTTTQMITRKYKVKGKSMAHAADKLRDKLGRDDPIEPEDLWYSDEEVI